MMIQSDYDSDAENGYKSDDVADRPLERWTPLGASNTTPPASRAEINCSQSELERLKSLEEEQEQLNSSLFALTAHFAQVQFRLKQIVDAPADQKETLLIDLEEFAFKGIPDARQCSFRDERDTPDLDHDHKIAVQRKKQTELISQLKAQLEDLETYAYETGDAEMPTSKVIEKQKAVIDELKTKLDLDDLNHFNNLSTEELRQAVDKAIGQIINPAKVKEKLVEQLKTQIIDLERFVEFLQGETLIGQACTCPIHDQPFSDNGTLPTDADGHPGRLKTPHENMTRKSLREQTMAMMHHVLTMLHIFTVTQFGCAGQDFQKNLLKRTMKGNHWGDLRARLEVEIERVIDLATRNEQVKAAKALKGDNFNEIDESTLIQCDLDLVCAVRKGLAMSLKDLLQHGLFEVGHSQSVLPFGCLPSRKSGSGTRMMHAWDLFVKYYEIKHGKEYNDAPIRRLSKSFDLSMVGGKAITTKQTLLSAIEEVVNSHGPLKRSEDAQFKAFVCHGLNSHKLVPWLRILVRNGWLIEYYYQPWSYVVNTGFGDSLASLDKLTSMDFNLPTDFAIRSLSTINDVF